MQQFRQGDVFLIQTEAEVPTGEVIANDPRGPILAEGEVTGHHHVVADPTAQLYPLPRTDDRLLILTREAPLVHEEHGTLTIPPGQYRVRIQREYAPEEIRRVVD